MIQIIVCMEGRMETRDTAHTLGRDTLERSLFFINFFLRIAASSMIASIPPLALIPPSLAFSNRKSLGLCTFYTLLLPQSNRP